MANCGHDHIWTRPYQMQFEPGPPTRGPSKLSARVFLRALATTGRAPPNAQGLGVWNTEFCSRRATSVHPHNNRAAETNRRTGRQCYRLAANKLTGKIQNKCFEYHFLLVRLHTGSCSLAVDENHNPVRGIADSEQEP